VDALVAQEPVLVLVLAVLEHVLAVVQHVQELVLEPVTTCVLRLRKQLLSLT
jgi:hypothetical protein